MAAEYTTLRAGNLNANDFFGDIQDAPVSNKPSPNTLDSLFNQIGRAHV